MLKSWTLRFQIVYDKKIDEICFKGLLFFKENILKYERNKYEVNQLVARNGAKRSIT